MRAVITGGTGLIGRALAVALAGKGWNVVVLTRNPNPSHLPQGVRAAVWDGKMLTGWQTEVDGCDALVHLAGEGIADYRWSAKRKANILSSRVSAGEALTAAVKTATVKPAVLVQASAVGFYGISTESTFTEASSAGQDWLASVCLGWEGATAPVEGWGVRRVVVRTGVVLDAHAGALPRMLLPFRLFVGGPLGSGRQWISWIHWRDEVDALVHLIENPLAHGIYNLTAPEPLRNADFGHAISRVLNRPYWAPVPSLALKLVLGEMSTMVLNGQRVLPERLVGEGYRFKFVRAEDALQDILHSQPHNS